MKEIFKEIKKKLNRSCVLLEQSKNFQILDLKKKFVNDSFWLE